MIKKVFVLFAAFAVLAGSSVAAEFTVGAGVGAISSPYRGQDIKLLPEPYLEIDSKYFYISFPFQANTPLAPSAGIHLINTSPFTLNVKGSFMKDQLEPDDNDHGDMRLLDKRKASLGGGIDITARTAFGIFSLDASMDILGNNKGMMASAAYSLPLDLGSIEITPTVGVLWQSEDYNTYYYGVTASESIRSGIGQYEADASFTPFASLAGSINITEQFKVVVSAEAMLLPAEIKDSPIVDESLTWSAFAGLSYTFN